MLAIRGGLVFSLITWGMLYAQAPGGGNVTGAVATIAAPLGSEQQAPNTYLLGASTGISYDNNALNSTRNVSDVMLAAYTVVGLSLRRARSISSLTWISGFSYSSANLPAYNFLAQGVGATWEYHSSQRLSVELSESFTYSTNPFDSLRSTAVLPQFGTLGTPTYITWNYIPKTIEAAGATATYTVSQRTSAYVSAGYQYLGYEGLQNAATLAWPALHTQSGTAEIGVSRQQSQRYSIGLQYGLQVLDYADGQVETTGQSLQIQAKARLSSTISVSGAIGPQYVDSKLNSILNIDGRLAGTTTVLWSWMGGATLNWTGRHNGFGVSAIRQINTGTGFEGNVQQAVANIQFHHDFAKNTSVYVFGNYTFDQPLVLARLVAVASSSYVSAGARFTRTFTNHLLFGATYWTVRQNSPANFNSLYSGNHNRFEFSLIYQLTRPLKSQ